MATEVPEELVRGAWDAYNRGDVAATVAAFDPERLTVFSPVTMANAGTYHGIDGFVEWVGHWNEAWDTFQTEIIELAQLGDNRVITRMRQFGIGRGSGIEVEMETSWVFEVEDGLCTYIAIHPTYDEARAHVAERAAAAAESGG